MRKIKYKGKIYIEVDSTKDELYHFIQRAKDELANIYKFIAQAKASQRLWEASGDKEQISADKKFLRAAEEYAAKLSKTIE